MPGKIDNGDDLAWRWERLEAARVFCSVLLISAIGSFMFQSGQRENWAYLAAALIGIMVALRPLRWIAIVVFIIALLGPGVAIVRRIFVTVDVLGIKEARLEQQALLVAGTAIFFAVALNAIIGFWYLLRSASPQLSILHEPFSYNAAFRLPSGVQGLGRGRSGVIALLVAAGLCVSIGLAGALNWSFAFDRAFAAEMLARVSCYGRVNPFGGEEAVRAIEQCSKGGRFAFLWSVLGATVLPIAFLICGLRLSALGRRRYVSGAAELMKNDRRAPIVFLRPFSDDRVALRGPPTLWRRLLWWGRTHPTLDELLVLECSQHGPVIAIGRPGERVKSFGVSRVFTRDQEWPAIVDDFTRNARAIVLVGGTTSGLEYELELAGRPGIAEKTIILAPPTARPPAKNRDLWSFVALKTAGRFATNGDSIIAVKVANTVTVSLSSRDFSSIDYVVALRWFFALGSTAVSAQP